MKDLKELKPLWNLIKEENSFVGILSDLIRFDKKYESIITNQLGNVIVAKKGYNSYAVWVFKFVLIFF